MSTDALVTTDWLARHLHAPDVKVADATYFLPGSGRDARREYQDAHIPGAVFFDIDEIADEASPLPHMLPSAAKFSSCVRKLGLGDGVRVVLYDRNAFSASARAWWMFRLFGHDDVAVLDGGLSRWQAEGGPLSDDPVVPAERHFTARQNNLLVRELEQLRVNLTTHHDQVVDSRSAERFTGSTAEPRAGLRAGHIPGSVNVPVLDLIDADSGRLLPAELLNARFELAGLDLQRPIVTTCGSAVTAATVALALHQIGRRDVPVYDGSWSEWGSRPDTPLAR